MKRIIMRWGPHLIVAVVGVLHDGQDVPDGEDDGGQPGSPQSNVNLVGEKMVFQHQPASGSLVWSCFCHRGLCRVSFWKYISVFTPSRDSTR